MGKRMSRATWCDDCDDTFVVPGRGGAPHECPRCALVLRLGMAYVGRGRNFDGKWWAAYGDKPDFQKRVMVELGVQLRFAGEALFQGFHSRPETPTSTPEVNEVLANLEFGGG